MKTVGLFSVFTLASAAAPVPWDCPANLVGVYADIHDGDQKEVRINGTSMTIKPFGNKQTWVVNSVLDRDSCSASVDFNVPGKPGPPPVNLSATFSRAEGADVIQSEIEFTDPSGTIAAKDFPLNRWVGLDVTPPTSPVTCPKSLKALYADLRGGGQNTVSISDGKLTVEAKGKILSEADFDTKSCSAVLDFDGPGSTGNIKARVMNDISSAGTKGLIELTWPDEHFPGSVWVQITKESSGVVV